MNKNTEYYMGLPYTLELWRTPDEGGWVVQVRELPGCVSQGETAEEALAMIQDAMQGWLDVALEMGDPIPEPRPRRSTAASSWCACRARCTATWSRPPTAKVSA